MALIGDSKRSKNAMLDVADGLAAVAYELGQDLAIIDARGVHLREMSVVQAQMRGMTQTGTRVLVMLRLPSANPVTVPIAQLADASILAVVLGETSQIAAAQAIEQVGKRRFLGSIVLRSA